MSTSRDPIEFQLEDDSEGPTMRPGRVPHSVLMGFLRDVGDFVRGDMSASVLDYTMLDVTGGYLTVFAAPPQSAADSLDRDLRRLAENGSLSGISPKRAAVLRRWRDSIHRSIGRRYSIKAPGLDQSLVLDARTQFFVEAGEPEGKLIG